MNQHDSPLTLLDILVKSIESEDFVAFIKVIRENVSELTQTHFEFIIEQIPLTTEFITEHKDFCLEIINLVNENNSQFESSKTNMKYGLIEAVLSNNTI